MGSHAGLSVIRLRTLVVVLLPLLFCTLSLAQPAVLEYTDCFSTSHGNSTEKLQVDTVYAQITNDNTLNLTIVGYSNVPIVGRSNDSTSLGKLLLSY